MMCTFVCVWVCERDSTRMRECLWVCVNVCVCMCMWICVWVCVCVSTPWRHVLEMGLSVTHSKPAHHLNISDQLHTQAPSPPGKNPTPCYPLNIGLGGHQKRSGHFWGEKNVGPTMIWTTDLPAHSVSQCNNYTALTNAINIIKYSDIPLLLDVIHCYVAMPYWLKGTPCAMFWCK